MAPRSNPYLGRAPLLASARENGPEAPAFGTEDRVDHSKGPHASFVRRSFSRRSTVGTAVHEGVNSVVGEYEPPSAMEIIDYAKYLGMNPIFDADLLWVAAEGLTARAS